MTGAGYLMISRSMLEEPLLQDGAYFRAWFWMVSEAAWKPRRVRVTNGRAIEIIELEQGQLTHSHSYLAKAWGWSQKRVRTFLKRLQAVHMIDLQPDRLQTVITICNYDVYQGAPDNAGRQTGRQEAGKGPEEEYIEEGNNRSSARKAVKNPKEWPEDGFGHRYALYPRKKDRGAAERAFAKARVRGLIGFDELLAATRRFAEAVNRKDPQFVKFPATWLNADSYLDVPEKPYGIASDQIIAEPSLDAQTFTDADWRDRLNNNWANGEWSSLWGPRPGQPGCKVPRHLLNGGAHG